MEEKKFDVNSLIGFLLIGAILLWMFYINKPTPEQIETEKQKTEQVERSPEQEAFTDEFTPLTAADSAETARAQSRLGEFGYSATLPSATENTTTLENEVLQLMVDNKGGYISEARVKGFKTFDSIPVHLIRDGNSSFNISFSTTDGRRLNSKDLYFEPSVT